MKTFHTDGMYPARIFLVVLAIIGSFFLFSQSILADDASSMGIATYLQVQGKDIKDGDIVSYANNGYVLSTVSYDPLAVGIITQKPAVAIVEIEKKGYPVVSSGNAYVNVSTANGPIKTGDLITSSNIPGIGVKAVHSGYVIGSSLEDYTQKDPKTIGQIAVALNIHYFANKVSVSTSLFDVLHISAAATYEEPTVVFKYFIAGLVVVISFVFGFIFFGRAANRGIEALGRNPLAGNLIQFGIFLNVLVTIAIIASGILVAFFVLRL